MDVELANAIERGSLEGVDAALMRGASLDADPMEGLLPLHRAVIAQNVAITVRLLTVGACPARVDDSGTNALDLAATLDDVRVVAALVAFDAPLDGRSDEGYTPLMSAAGRSPEIAALLIAAGADVDAVNDEGRTALDEAVALGDLQTAELIVRSRKEPRPQVNAAAVRRPASSSS